MLDLLVAHATDAWSRWFPNGVASAPTPLLLAGGPAHGDRVSVLLFGAGERAPRAIIKVGFTPLEGEFLQSEFDAMDRLRPLLPDDLGSSMPRALDLVRIGETTAMVAEVLAGHRLLVPRLTGPVSKSATRIMDAVFRRSFAFTRALARATMSEETHEATELTALTDRFAERFLADSPDLAGLVHEFGRALAQGSITWHTAWQHQDMAVGNILEHRGQLHFLDWEHAAPGCVPWFDVAYTPVVTSHLARRVDNLSSIREAALGVLGPATPVGAVLRARMEEIWDYPIPLPWAVTLAAMEGALRRLDDGREGSPEYAHLVGLMISDEELRSELDWLVPDW